MLAGFSGRPLRLYTDRPTSPTGHRPLRRYCRRRDAGVSALQRFAIISPPASVPKGKPRSRELDGACKSRGSDIQAPQRPSTRAPGKLRSDSVDFNRRRAAVRQTARSAPDGLAGCRNASNSTNPRRELPVAQFGWLSRSAGCSTTLISLRRQPAGANAVRGTARARGELEDARQSLARRSHRRAKRAYGPARADAGQHFAPPRQVEEFSRATLGPLKLSLHKAAVTAAIQATAPIPTRCWPSILIATYGEGLSCPQRLCTNVRGRAVVEDLSASPESSPLTSQFSAS